MAALEALRWRPGHDQDDQDLMSTEGKGMVPRYDVTMESHPNWLSTASG